MGFFPGLSHIFVFSCLVLSSASISYVLSLVTVNVVMTHVITNGIKWSDEWAKMEH